jgi:hypothetical protein
LEGADLLTGFRRVGFRLRWVVLLDQPVVIPGFEMGQKLTVG